ncbi:MAG TPA: hypothetical protein DER70_02195, partial [Lentisphaeria bacterium]|nr:hypothetical protein [Lentisphaeria bacterium]
MAEKQTAVLNRQMPQLKKNKIFLKSGLEILPSHGRGIAFYFGLLISDEKISVGFLIAILILLAVC